MQEDAWAADEEVADATWEMENVNSNAEWMAADERLRMAIDWQTEAWDRFNNIEAELNGLSDILGHFET